MALGNLLALVGGQRLRGPDRILDLAPVDLGLGQLGKVVAGKVRIEGGGEIAPHLLARLGRQVPVVEADVDARVEGLVEGAHPAFALSVSTRRSRVGGEGTGGYRLVVRKRMPW